MPNTTSETMTLGQLKAVVDKALETKPADRCVYLCVPDAAPVPIVKAKFMETGLPNPPEDGIFLLHPDEPMLSTAVYGGILPDRA
jgi:hypothetical protein